jgi:hypothetical protein
MREHPSLIRWGILGAIAAGLVGVANSILNFTRYGFSRKIGGAPVQLPMEAGMVFSLALLGMLAGIVLALVLRRMHIADAGTMARWHPAAVWGSAACCLAVGGCHLMQPDILAAVILVPAWCWLVPGLALLMLGYGRGGGQACIAVLFLWIVFAVIFVEESRSLLRADKEPTAHWCEMREEGRGVRVVSLNCYTGQANSVREVAAWDPDIVLLQESPDGEQVGRLAQELFGDRGVYLYGGDTSILAAGEIEPKTPRRASHFVHAQVQLPTGFTADVISLRLAPPVFRMDFWRPGFWIDHRDKRRQHRRQIGELASHLGSVPVSSQLIVGGDFNSPPSDDALAALRPRLVDAFRQAGRGWGGTGTNAYPLFRVDQIWISNHLQASSVTARETVHSDHKMVVCDLLSKD